MTEYVVYLLDEDEEFLKQDAALNGVSMSCAIREYVRRGVAVTKKAQEDRRNVNPFILPPNMLTEPYSNYEYLKVAPVRYDSKGNILMFHDKKGEK
jgi:hypothetical protein